MNDKEVYYEYITLFMNKGKCLYMLRIEENSLCII